MLSTSSSLSWCSHWVYNSAFLYLIVSNHSGDCNTDDRFETVDEGVRRDSPGQKTVCLLNSVVDLAISFSRIVHTRALHIVEVLHVNADAIYQVRFLLLVVSRLIFLLNKYFSDLSVKMCAPLNLSGLWPPIRICFKLLNDLVFSSTLT
jgi:hypothetical protein